MSERVDPQDPDVADFVRALAALGSQPTFRFPDEDVPAVFRRAAVLLLFAPHEGAMSLVMTRRTARMSTHAGEVCFPGGRIEAGETATEAALREAEEEIGLPREAVRIHGRLDDAWAFGGFVVVPIVASMDRMPMLRPTSDEVELVLVEPVDELFEDSRLGIEILRHRGIDYRNATIRLTPPDVLYGLSTDLLLEVKDRLATGRSERGLARLEELRETVAAGQWTPT